jgi:CHAT domain-containing protein
MVRLKLNKLSYLITLILVSIAFPVNSQVVNNKIPKIQIKSQQEIIQATLDAANKNVSLGYYFQAIEELNSILNLKINDSHTEASIFETLGNSYSGLGQFEKASQAYKQSLKLEESLSCLNNLVKTQGNIVKITQIAVKEAEKTETKQKYRLKLVRDRVQLQNSALLAVDLSQTDFSLSASYALFNWVNLLEQSLSLEQIEHIENILNTQPASRVLVFALINYSKLERGKSLFWLLKAEKIAAELKDPVAQSDSLLHLGYYFQKIGKLDMALNYSLKSQMLAQSNFLSESLFRSQWLAGQIYAQKKNFSSSLISYQNAIANLESKRKDSNQLQIDRSNDSQIYREFIMLLLEQEQVKSKDLVKALQMADKLRLDQLQSFFGDDCFQIVRSSKVGQDSHEAVLTSIVLSTKTYVILQLPDGSIYFNRVNITKSALKKLSFQWRDKLFKRNTWEFQKEGQQLYNLLLRPFEQQLADSNFKVLVFVNDSVLRNLPMAALFDGQQFVAQKWASVSSLGINLTPRAKAVNNAQATALVFGLSNPKQSGWSDLPQVPSEVESVHQLIKGKKYLNKDFSTKNLLEQLENYSYSVVHLATHGYFGGNAKDSFILTYDNLISVLNLEQYLANQTGIDLLVLSACETALTSERSLLGMAGIAARSGVSSTLGTLWQVQDDEISFLIQDFYKYWHLESTKAIALQKVQQKQIEQYAHPNKWASLTLIGDSN